MKKIFALTIIAITLGGCAGTRLGDFIATVNSAATGTVSPEAIYIARNAFDAVEVSATNYLSLSKCPVKAPFCRDPSVTVPLTQAIRSGRVARNNATQFLRDHPNQLGEQGLYDALTKSTDTIKAILKNYSVSIGGLS